MREGDGEEGRGGDEERELYVCFITSSRLS